MGQEMSIRENAALSLRFFHGNGWFLVATVHGKHRHFGLITLRGVLMHAPPLNTKMTLENSFMVGFQPATLVFGDVTY